MSDSTTTRATSSRSNLPPRSSSLAGHHSQQQQQQQQQPLQPFDQQQQQQRPQQSTGSIDYSQSNQVSNDGTMPSNRMQHQPVHDNEDDHLVATLALDSNSISNTNTNANTDTTNTANTDYSQPQQQYSLQHNMNPLDDLSTSVQLPVMNDHRLPPLQQITPEGDQVEDDIDTRRPKKRKSVANLRAQANAQASTSKQQSSTAAPEDDDDDDDDGSKNRRKISIEYIEEKSKRHITFSKRKAGIMKKAYELSTLTGTQVLLLVVSESGWVYTFTTEKFKPLVKEDEHGQLSQGQKLIAACLEAREDGQQQTNSRFRSPADGTFDPDLPHHGGQIALKPSSRGGPPGRMLATNRRVSGKGRSTIPAAIRTGSDQGLPQLPTPMSGYLGHNDSGLGSPVSPRGPLSRSVSGGPISPRNPGYNQMQHQQQTGGQQEWAQMMDMQQHAQHSHHPQYENGYDSMYSHGTPSPGLPLLSLHEQQQQGHPGDRYQPLHDHYAHGPPPHPQGHYTYHPDPNQHQQQRLYPGSQPAGQHQQQQQHSSSRGLATHPMYAQDEAAYVTQ